MGRSLKEALLDQMALLQERGLAPSDVPQEEESPVVVVETASRSGRGRVRREIFDRYTEEELGLDDGRDRRKLPRRGDRPEDVGDRRVAGARGRGGRPRHRSEEGGADLFGAPAPTPAPGGDRPMLGGRRPAMGVGGPRPPFRPGMGAPRPGGPMGPPRPMMGRTEMLQQRAEERRRDDEDIAEMRLLLAQHGGEEIDDAAMERFSRALAEETGALPPPRVVVAAIKQGQTADPRQIGNAVRAYYRRARSGRPQSGSPGGPGGPGPQGRPPFQGGRPAPRPVAAPPAPVPPSAAAPGSEASEPEAPAPPQSAAESPSPEVSAPGAPVAPEQDSPAPALEPVGASV